jgi:hypothetical protein
MKGENMTVVSGIADGRRTSLGVQANAAQRRRHDDVSATGMKALQDRGAPTNIVVGSALSSKAFEILAADGVEEPTEVQYLAAVRKAEAALGIAYRGRW